MSNRNVKWHQMTADAVMKELHTNAACGLSRKAARSRFKKQGANTLFDRSAERTNSVGRSVFTDPAVLLMLVTAVLSFLFAEPIPGLFVAVLLVACLGTVIRLLQLQKRLENVTEAYRIPTAEVIRDGRLFTVSARRVVPGDILILRAGDVVPCDCRLISEQNLRVLTLSVREDGKPAYTEMQKSAQLVYPYGSDVAAPQYENMLFGGSEILDGEARAVAVAIGENTFLGAASDFRIPAEPINAVGESKSIVHLRSFLHFYGIWMLVLLVLMAAIGFLHLSDSSGILDFFLPLCILVGSAAPMLLLFYFRRLEMHGRQMCKNNLPKENRALIKSVRTADRLCELTDLFIIGRWGSSDGKLHLSRCAVVSCEIVPDANSPQSLLQPLCEAFCLLDRASQGLAATDFQETDGEDLKICLSELISCSGYDVDAMNIRVLRASRRQISPTVCEADIELRDRRFVLLFSQDPSLLDRCMLYEENGHVCALSHELRSQMHTFCELARKNASRVRVVARRYSDGNFALIGILSLREQPQAVLPSVLEELTQCGVRVSFFLQGDSAEASCYADACKLPMPYALRTDSEQALSESLLADRRILIGYSREEILRLIDVLHQRKRCVAVLGGTAEDRRFFGHSALLIACDATEYDRREIEECAAERLPLAGREESARCAQGIRRHADLLIPRAERFSGGLSAFLQALSNSRSIRLKMCILLCFLAGTQLSRLIVTFLSICIGIGLPNAFGMLYSGIFAELIGGMMIASVRVPQNLLRKSAQFDRAGILRLLRDRKLWLPAVISSAVPVIYAMILTFCGVITESAASSYLFASLLLLCPTLLIVQLRRFGIFVYGKPFWYGLAILLTPILLLSLLAIPFPMLGMWVGSTDWNAVALLSLPLSVALYVLSSFFCGFFYRTAK